MSRPTLSRFWLDMPETPDLLPRFTLHLFNKYTTPNSSMSFSSLSLPAASAPPGPRKVGAQTH